MGRVKIRCPSCGARRFQFTLKNDEKKIPHGAVCCGCGEPLKVENVYRLFLVVSNHDDQHTGSAPRQESTDVSNVFISGSKNNSGLSLIADCKPTA